MGRDKAKEALQEVLDAVLRKARELGYQTKVHWADEYGGFQSIVDPITVFFQPRGDK